MASNVRQETGEKNKCYVQYSGLLERMALEIKIIGFSQRTKSKITLNCEKLGSFVSTFSGILVYCGWWFSVVFFYRSSAASVWFWFHNSHTFYDVVHDFSLFRDETLNLVSSDRRVFRARNRWPTSIRFSRNGRKVVFHENPAAPFQDDRPIKRT